MKILFIHPNREIRKYFALRYLGKHDILLADGKVNVANTMGFTFRSGLEIDRAIVSMAVGKDIFYYVTALRQCYPESKITITTPDDDFNPRRIIDAVNAGANNFYRESFVVENLEDFILSSD